MLIRLRSHIIKTIRQKHFISSGEEGTGIYGAGAMKEKDGNLIRPLLCVKKEEIVKYLKGLGRPG